MWRTVLVLLFAVNAFAEDELKPCAMLTAVEIREVAGITVGPGIEDIMGQLRQCSWAGDREGDLSLVLSFQKAAFRASCEKRWKGEKDLGRKVEDFPGFGDKAWWSIQRKDPALSVVAMNVCNNKGILRVSLWGGTGEEEVMKKMAEELARKAFQRLEGKN